MVFIIKKHANYNYYFEYFEYVLLLLYISVYKIYFNKTKFVSKFFIHRERTNLKRKRI